MASKRILLKLISFTTIRATIVAFWPQRVKFLNSLSEMIKDIPMLVCLCYVIIQLHKQLCNTLREMFA